MIGGNSTRRRCPWFNAARAAARFVARRSIVCARWATMGLSQHGSWRMDHTTSFHADCARIHRVWHECAARGDAAGLLALYAEDAVLESPLVPVVLDDAASGVLH